MAKDLVRTRNHVKKFHLMRANIQAISLKIQVSFEFWSLLSRCNSPVSCMFFQTLRSQTAMAQAMKGVTKVHRRKSITVHSSDVTGSPQRPELVLCFLLHRRCPEWTLRWIFLSCRRLWWSLRERYTSKRWLSWVLSHWLSWSRTLVTNHVTNTALWSVTWWALSYDSLELSSVGQQLVIFTPDL